MWSGIVDVLAGRSRELSHSLLPPPGPEYYVFPAAPFTILLGGHSLSIRQCIQETQLYLNLMTQEET